MFISEYLKLGRLEINPNKKCLEIVGNTLTVPYEKITPSDWGLVFEKFVGQVLEDEGYEVIFNGLNKGIE